MEVVVFVVDEKVPAPVHPKPSTVVAEICQYLTAEVVAECRARFPEIAAVYTREPQPEACGAAVALVEHALRQASARLIERIENRIEPGSQHLLLIA